MSSKRRPKIAIVHDQLYTIGGAERVLEDLVLCFPDADVFALFDILSPAQREALVGDRAIRTTWLQRLPGKRRFHRHLLPLMPLAVEHLDISGYDLIVSSSYLVAKGVVTRPDQVHVCYLHSPMRYAWDQEQLYVESVGKILGMRRALVRLILHYLRIWDARSANGVDVFVANSAYVARRALKAYRRDCRVVHPPVDTSRFAALHSEKRDPNLFITVSRLTPLKRIDVMIDAFRELPDCRLVVIGDGAERAALEESAPANVTFTGFVSDTEVLDWMGRASAFLFAAEEDFGISPVEAQACGLPVVALGRGGACETVRDIDTHVHQPTGVLFPEQSATALRAAIARLRQHRDAFAAEACRSQAAAFSRDRFRREIIDVVDETLEQYGTSRLMRDSAVAA